jgi:hypothetical protein
MNSVFNFVVVTILFLDAFAKMPEATNSFVISVSPYVRLSAWNNSAPTEGILMKFYTSAFLENLSRKLQFH